MTPAVTSVFALTDPHSPKSDPALTAVDEIHFAKIRDSLAETIADHESQLDAVRKAAAGQGQRALDRDQEVHRLTARLRTLRRFGLDACLGRMDPADGGEPVYVGRLGLTARDGARLLVDWRSPAAEPFFAATPATPMGLRGRRRYRWTQAKVSDYWDESLTWDDPAKAALDDDSALLTSLAASRTSRMRDVLATIAADQDAIVRATAQGALVVDGGPGTGKTVVALHRAAYLLYSDPRLRRDGSAKLLVVGPHRPYLGYVADVLPSLGEEGVQTCTVADLVPEGRAARREPDEAVARLKADARLVAAIEPAVALYEEPPTERIEVATPWGELPITARDWAEAFDAVDPGTPHNEARDQLWDALAGLLAENLDDEQAPPDALARHLRGEKALVSALHRAWPLLEATDVVADLFAVPAYLRRCAPWLTREEIATLQRPEGSPWTDADLPLLDAARRRLGDPDAERRRQLAAAARRAHRERMADVVADLVAADDSEMLVMSMLRRDDLASALDDPDGPDGPDSTDGLAGPFAHVVVDEAQELTDAQWQMLLARCPSRSFTVVGDRAQARRGFPESWRDRLERVGFGRVELATLTVNYRTPAEVMAEAEPVIRAVLPDANVPTSIRSTGVAVRHGGVSDRETIVAQWLATHPEGVACVIGEPGYRGEARVRSLTPELAKGLEFDLVVLVDPATWGTGIEAAVDRYVAMTRATQQLVVLTSR